ncbi:prepilin peptidase [Vibrio tritonius]|uniref:prepilin peptidase n=1 Tax=Vibrio tritonius TaxID=1435069 RepID=UPI00315DF25C
MNLLHQGLIYYVLVLSLTYIIITDCRHRIVGNNMIFFIIIIDCFLVKQYFDAISLAVAVITLVLGIIIFSLGICGAGDIKLLFVLIPIIDHQWLLLCFTLMFALGGILGVGLWLGDKFWPQFKLSEKGVPYAIPICISFGFGLFLTAITH